MSVGLVVSVLMNKQLRVELLVAFVNLVWSRFGFTQLGAQRIPCRCRPEVPVTTSGPLNLCKLRLLSEM